MTTSALIERIKNATPFGWQAQPIPAPVDEDLAALAASGDALDADLADALLGYAERMASLAVRSGERAPVLQGLAAVGHAWDACDEIEHAVVALGVLYDAARRVGDPAALFAEAAGGAPEGARPAYADFLRRRDLPQIAAEMGFIEGRDGVGFRYYRVW